MDRLTFVKPEAGAAHVGGAPEPDALYKMEAPLPEGLPPEDLAVTFERFVSDTMGQMWDYYTRSGRRLKKLQACIVGGVVRFDMTLTDNPADDCTVRKPT